MSKASEPVSCVLSDSLEEEVEGSLEPGALDPPEDSKQEDLDDSLCCEDSQVQLSCNSSSSQPRNPPPQTLECQELDDSISFEGMEAMEAGIPSVCTAAFLASSSAAQTPELPSRNVVCSTSTSSTPQQNSSPAVSSNSLPVCSTSPPSAPPQQSSSPAVSSSLPICSTSTPPAAQQSSSASNFSCPSQQVPKKKPVFGKKKLVSTAPPQPATPVPVSGSSTVAATSMPSERVEPSTSKESAQPSIGRGTKRAPRKPTFVAKAIPSTVKPVPSTKEILANFCAEEEAQKASKSSQSGDIIPTSETSQTDPVKTDTVNAEAGKVAVVSEAGKTERSDSAAPVPKAKKPRMVLTPEEKEAKRAEQEKKRLEREKKKEEAEKKKIEREMKKKEAEQKRLEREQKKNERETLKKQKQLDTEKKKAEREQRKIQKEIERQQKKARMIFRKAGSSGSVSASSNLSTPADGEEGNGGQSADISAQASSYEEAEMRTDEELDSELDVDGFDDTASDDKARSSSALSSLSESASAGSVKSTCSRISREQSAGSMDTADGSSSTTSSEPSKIANNDAVVPVKKPTKRFKPPTTRAAPKPKRSKSSTATAATGRKKTTGSVKKSSSGSKKGKKQETSEPDSSNNEDGSSSDSNPSENEEVEPPPVLLPMMKRSQSVFLTGSVWVQCEDASCRKWRKLSGCDDPSELPVNWKCSMNVDREHSSCSVPEETWNNLEDNQEYVESNLVPGSLVWAKMDGYPWWPAMVEQDPDVDSFYKMGNASCRIPVQYHVVFFDTPVSRGWINSHSIHPFSDMEDANAELHLRVAQKHKKALQNGLKQVKTALTIPLKERLVKYGFFSRYQRLQAVSRKKMYFTATTESPSLSFHSQSSSDTSFDDENRIPKQLQLAGDNSAAGIAAAKRLAAHHEKKETETVVIQFEE